MVSEDQRVRRTSRASCGLSLETWGAEAWRWRCPNSRSRDQGPTQQSDRETESNCLHFHSAQVLHGSDEASSHWGQLSALSNPLIQMLVSPRNTLTSTHPESVVPVIWTLHDPGGLVTGTWDLRCLQLPPSPSWNTPRSMGCEETWDKGQMEFKVPVEPGPGWSRREPPSWGAQQTSHHTAEAAWRIRRRVVSVMLKPRTPGWLGTWTEG